ncbi:uncharacterized protein LOC109947958 [Prunus persica]|uniref:uncharacterized protein LOC109947958 n=1 Tax=Prunus persica TaxID=3760 RepID=UPI0009AB8E14|nr:uncharacterized protein LOC109947958 [Prunus persica]
MHKGADSIEKYLLRLKTARDQLVAVGEHITYDDVVITALNGLPQDYDMIRIVLLARDSTIGLKDLRAQLLNAERQAEIRMLALSHSMNTMMATRASSQHTFGGYNSGGAKHFSQGSSSTQGSSSRPHNGYNGSQFRSSPQSDRFKSLGYHGSRFYSDKHGSNSSGFKQQWGPSSGSKPHVILECQLCSKRGHATANCFYHNTTDSNSSPVIQCQICGKKGHGALDCYHRANFAFQGQPLPASLQAMTAYAQGFESQDNWIADTGATHHMTPNLSVLETAPPYDQDDKIIVGNGEGQGNKGSSSQRKE